MTAEIQIHQLTKKFPKGPQALKGVNLEIKKGELFTLLGPNGAGKSTLVKIATTLLKKDSGQLTIAGLDPEVNPGRVRSYIGVASQENELDPAEHVENMLRFQCRLYGLSRAETASRTEELIEAFDLHEHRKKKCENLSGGNKRRLHCALALVHKPGLLFLDEPTVGMDPEARSRFWQVINMLNKRDNTTIFLTTQYLEEADKHASTMALIMDGEIHFTGPVASFKKMVNQHDQLTLEESYLQYVSSPSAVAPWQ